MKEWPTILFGKDVGKGLFSCCYAADQSFILSPVEEWGGGLWPT